MLLIQVKLELLKNNFQVDFYFASNQIEPISSTKLKERYRPKKTVTDILDIPIFNSPGNHDVSNRALYKKYFGETYFHFFALLILT